MIPCEKNWHENTQYRVADSTRKLHVTSRRRDRRQRRNIPMAAGGCGGPVIYTQTTAQVEGTRPSYPEKPPRTQCQSTPSRLLKASGQSTLK